MTQKKQSKKEVSKKIVLSTMTATMAVGGVVPLVPGVSTEAHAQELSSVTNPTNVLVTKNNGEQMTVQWDKNNSPEGTQYYLMANARDGAIKTANIPVSPQMNGWKLNPQPYFEKTPSAWYQTGKTAGDNILSFETTVPEHVLESTFSFRYDFATNDVLTVKIDGKQMTTLKGFRAGTLSYPLTPGKHKIEFVFNNTLNEDYAGAAFIKDLNVSYKYKDSIFSDWVDSDNYTFQGLDVNKDYDVRIVAKNGESRSVVTNGVVATNITSEPVSNGTKLSWTPTTSGAMGYQVVRDGEIIYEGNARTFTDEDVVGRTKYRYIVNTIDVNGDVVETMYKRVETPEYANVTGQPTLSGADLAWTYTKEATTVEKYQVFRGGEMVYEGTQQAFLDRDAFGGRDYDYTLKVIGENGRLLETDTLKVSMPVNPPKDVILTKDEPNEKNVIWNHNHNNPETEYKVLAKPVNGTSTRVAFTQNLNGQSFPSAMNLKVTNWRAIKPYWQSNTTDLWYEPIDYVGTNTISFDADIPFAATTPKFEMSYSSVSNDVMEIKVNGVRKWSRVGYDRNAGGDTKLKTSVDLTPGMVNKVEVIFNNTNNNGDYGGTSFVDDLTVSYNHDGTVESPWTKDSAYTLTGLNPSKDYTVSVQAKNQTKGTAPVSGQSSVQLGLTQNDGAVQTTFDYLLDGVTSYQLLRDGETIYEGSNDSFEDDTTRGATNYSYTLIAKDADGKTLGSTKKNVVTPNYVSATAQIDGGNVKLDMGYAKDRDVTYTVTRNGETLYQGTSESFVDQTALGATDYTYVVTVKEGSNVVGSTTVSARTPIATPTRLKVEQSSPTSVTASWEDIKNPSSTEYMVTAVPVGGAPTTKIDMVDDFETGTSPFVATGNWTRTTADKKTGSYSLRSAVIGNNGTTTQSYTVNIPTDAVNALLTFDYRISSEQNYDFFFAYVNGVQVVKDSGSQVWKSVSRALTTGTNSIRFEYKKDGSQIAGSDAVFIDNIRVKTDGKVNPTSGWVKGKTVQLSGLEAGVEYEYRLVAKANGLQTAPILMNNNVVQEATEGVEALGEDLETVDLSDRANIAEAQVILDELKTMVEALEDGEDKEALLAKVAQLQDVLTKAEQVVDATDAVSSLEVPTVVESFEQLEEAKTTVRETQALVDVLDEGETKTQLQATLDEAKTELVKVENIFVAKEEVKETTAIVEKTETREEVETAKEAIEEAKTAVEKVADEELQATLNGQLDELVTKVAAVVQVLDTKDAVLELQTVVENVETLEGVEAAKQQMVETELKVSELPESQVKATLAETVAEVKEVLNETEFVLVTDAGLDEVEAKATAITTRDEMVAVNEQVETLEGRISQVKDEVVKSTYAERLETVQYHVKVAEASFAVEDVVQSPSTETLAQAKTEVAQLNDGEKKEELANKVELMETVVTMQNKIATIQTTDYTTIAEIDTVIPQLEGMKVEISSIQQGDVRFAQKAKLTEAHKKASFHVGTELTTVLQDTKKERYKGGLKEPLKAETLTFLVGHTVNKNVAVYVKDKVDFIFDYLPSSVESYVNTQIRGLVHGELQPLLGKTVTGKQLNDLIDSQLKLR